MNFEKKTREGKNEIKKERQEEKEREIIKDMKTFPQIVYIYNFKIISSKALDLCLYSLSHFLFSF